MWCYLFEAHSIQRWIFAGGKLRDCVGASALLDGVCAWEGEDLFGEALEACSLSEGGDLKISRRAGGGLCVYAQDRAALARLRAVFTLKLRAAAPDLPFADGLGEGKDMPSARFRAMQAQRAARNAPPADPFRAGPFLKIAPRTGRPAVLQDKSTKELLDAGLAAKRRVFRAMRRDDRLGLIFDPKARALWPTEMSPEKQDGGEGIPFPFEGENRHIGLLHADGNGLGGLLIKLDGALRAQTSIDYAQGFAEFSQAVGEATRRAAQEATEAMAPEIGQDGVWPFRPLVLGGDDLSVLLRGDIAIRFTEVFLKAFAQETGVGFAMLKSQNSFWRGVLPERLTAGGGIVFLRANQPFDQAYAFCENLAKAAKDEAKTLNPQTPPSSLAFHRLTSSDLPESWAEVAEGLTLEESKLSLTMNPYLIDEAEAAEHGQPSIAALRDLRKILERDKIGRGPARRLTSAGIVRLFDLNASLEDFLRSRRELIGQITPKPEGVGSGMAV